MTEWRSAPPRAPAAALIAFAALALGACGFFDSTTDTAGAGGSVAPPATLQWWATCGAPSCPDAPDPPVIPCNGDQRPGAPCDYSGATCDARLACGAVLYCSTEDPRADGCP